MGWLSEKDTRLAYLRMTNAEGAWWDWRVARAKSVAHGVLAVLFLGLAASSLFFEYPGTASGFVALFFGGLCTIVAALFWPRTLKYVVQCDLINAQKEYDALAERDLLKYFPEEQE